MSELQRSWGFRDLGSPSFISLHTGACLGIPLLSAYQPPTRGGGLTCFSAHFFLPCTAPTTVAEGLYLGTLEAVAGTGPSLPALGITHIVNLAAADLLSEPRTDGLQVSLGNHPVLFCGFLFFYLRSKLQTTAEKRRYICITHCLTNPFPINHFCIVIQTLTCAFHFGH